MRLALALTLVLFLGGCLSPLGLLSSFGGGGGGNGTSVNANTQIGKENNQSAIDQSRDISGEDVNVNQSQGAFTRVDVTVTNRNMERILKDYNIR